MVRVHDGPHGNATYVIVTHHGMGNRFVDGAIAVAGATSGPSD